MARLALIMPGSVVLHLFTSFHAKSAACLFEFALLTALDPFSGLLHYPLSYGVTG
jgi:hypothetical protein